MASSSLLLLLLFGLLLLPASAVPLNETVYEVLPQYGLPGGLLPDAVASYTLGNDGRFEVELGRPSCYVHFGRYVVYYEHRITGSLELGSIRGLKGIQVQRLFLWLGVDEIEVDLPPAEGIYFQVGWITKRLPLEEFRSVHSCLDRAAFTERIKNMFPEPLYDIEELITGDVHVAL